MVCVFFARFIFLAGWPEWETRRGDVRLVSSGLSIQDRIKIVVTKTAQKM